MKITMQPAISLDGFIAKIDGDSYSWVNQADEARYQAVVEQCGAVIVGRTTYEEYKQDFEKYRNVKIFVCSTDESIEDSDSLIRVHGPAEEMINKIGTDYGFDELIVCGGGEINGLLASAGLVSDIVVSIQPQVLGEGIPLFGNYKPNLKLQLLSVNTDIAGVIQNHYLVLE